MAMPDLALDWVHRIMRILLKYRAVGGLDAQAGALLRLAKQLRALRARLSDPSRTSIVVVTVEEPLVGAETRRLLDSLRQFDLPTTALVVNRWQAGEAPAAPTARSLVRRELPVFHAPLVAEPTGTDALAAFLRSWERVQ
jgi:anion-transporting  ArsA/GET3 family ATPase